MSCHAAMECESHVRCLKKVSADWHKVCFASSVARPSASCLDGCRITNSGFRGRWSGITSSGFPPFMTAASSRTDLASVKWLLLPAANERRRRRAGRPSALLRFSERLTTLWQQCDPRSRTCRHTISNGLIFLESSRAVKRSAVCRSVSIVANEFVHFFIREGWMCYLFCQGSFKQQMRSETCTTVLQRRTNAECFKNRRLTQRDGKSKSGHLPAIL